MMQNLHIFRNQTCQFDKIAPLENGTLVTFVNNCLYAMIEQLNNFACYVESRMITLNHQIDTCHSNLVILEMKLNSINIPNQVLISKNNQNTYSQVKEMSEPQTMNNPINASLNTPSHNELDASQTDAIEINDSQTSENDNLTSDDAPGEDLSEELEKYRKMLRFGVHESAVRQKMVLEGEDPARLNL